jgi:hypothetical protein
MGFDGYVSINARRDFNARKFWLASFVRILIEPHFSAYKARHANSAPKIRLATMASNKARDGRLSPRAMLIW